MGDNSDNPNQGPGPAKWQDKLRSNILQLKTAATAGDVNRIRMLHEQFTVAASQHYETLSKDMLSTNASDSGVYSSLKQIADTGTDETKKNGDDVHDDLDRFKDTPEGKSGNKDAWKDRLHKRIGEAKDNSAAMYDKMEREGVAKIEQLPERAQDGAADIFGAAVSQVSHFVGNIVNWISDALGKIWDFLKGVWDKLVGFAKQIGGWASAAWNGIKSVFGGIFGFMAAAPRGEDFLLQAPRQSFPGANGFPFDVIKRLDGSGGGGNSIHDIETLLGQALLMLSTYNKGQGKAEWRGGLGGPPGRGFSALQTPRLWPPPFFPDDDWTIKFPWDNTYPGVKFPWINTYPGRGNDDILNPGHNWDPIKSIY